MNTGMTMRRLPSDEPMVTELPEGTTDRDYPRFYQLMSYVQFMELLTKTHEQNHHA